MKKTMVTVFSILFFVISKAQVAEFLSLQFALSLKDSKGNFVQAKEWIGQEIYINFNLSEKKIQFFSKGMLDVDTFSLKKEIIVLNKNTSSDIINDKMIRQFSGIDKSGKKCIVRLKLIKDEYKVQDRELRVEYMDAAEIYKLKLFRQNPMFNKS